MLNRSLGHRAPLLWLVLPMMAGLAAGQAGEWAAVGWQLAAATLAAALALVAAWRAPRWWAPALVGALFLAGSARYALERARIPVWDTLPPREARLAIEVRRVFPSADPGRTSGLGTVVTAENHLRELAGQRLFFSLNLVTGEAPPLRGAVISALGVVAPLPRNPPADTFDGYLANSGMNFRLSRGRLLATEQPASAYRRFCERRLADFKRTLGRGVAERHQDLTGILRAMLLGQKHELSDDHDTLFLRSGTMHLFAISGLHIGVIWGGIYGLLALLRLPVAVRFTAGLAALWLYVDITGATPSAVRAFLMVALAGASFVFRVPRNLLPALAGSALVIVLVSPLQIFSASFQMSYGIVAALLLLGVPLAEALQARVRLFRDLPAPAWRWHHHLLHRAGQTLAAALAIGLASSLVSAISGVRYFQLFTPGALLANLVLIPSASLVILAGFLSLLCGLLGATPWSVLFNHAAVLVLACLDTGIRALVTLPGTWRPAHFTAAWMGPAALVTLLAVMLAGYAAHWRRERGGWWPPFLVVATALILGVRFE